MDLKLLSLDIFRSIKLYFL